jgi:hypothetical protein
LDLSRERLGEAIGFAAGLPAAVGNLFFKRLFCNWLIGLWRQIFKELELSRVVDVTLATAAEEMALELLEFEGDRLKLASQGFVGLALLLDQRLQLLADNLLLLEYRLLLQDQGVASVQIVGQSISVRHGPELSLLDEKTQGEFSTLRQRFFNLMRLLR